MVSKLRRWYRGLVRLFTRVRRDWKGQRHIALPYSLRACPPVTDTLIFLHIPKTAGTTLRTLTQAICLAKKELNIRIAVTEYNPPVFCVPRWQGAWTTIQSYSTEELSKQRLISGHFPFGIHARLPQSSTYITLLRDPVDREISSFNHHFQLGNFKESDSLEKFLHNKQLMDNPQTRMIAGAQYCLDDRCSEATFLQAKENLRSKFLIVGVKEEFNEFLSALLALQKWPAVKYSERRVTELKLINNINESTRKDLEQLHSFDVKLHQFVKENWKDWLSEYIDFERKKTGMQEVLNIPWHFIFSQRYSLSCRKLVDQSVG